MQFLLSSQAISYCSGAPIIFPENTQEALRMIKLEGGWDSAKEFHKQKGTGDYRKSPTLGTYF